MRILSKIAQTALCFSLLWMAAAGHAESAPGRDISIHAAVQAARQEGVPEAVIVDLLSDGFEAGLNADQMAPLVHVLSEVRQADLPLPPFLTKIHEGLHKQIDPRLLMASLHRRMDDYRFVRRQLQHKYAGRNASGRSDLTVLVESLDLGLSRESMARLFQQAPAVAPAMLAVAANNLALLDQLDFPRRLAEEMLLTGLKHQHLTTRWAGLFKVAAAARRKGISDERLAEVVKMVLRSGGDLPQVLKALDFTSRDVRHGPYWRPAPENRNEP